MNEKLTFEEVAERLCQKDARSVKSYVENGLLKAVKVENDFLIEEVLLAKAMGVIDLVEPFIKKSEAEKLIGFELNYDICKKKNISFYRMANMQKSALLFRKSDIDLWLEKTNEIGLEYVPHTLHQITRDNILRFLAEIISVLWPEKRREEQIFIDYLRGDTYEDIAERRDITRERVRQIVHHFHRRMSVVRRFIKDWQETLKENGMENETPQAILGKIKDLVKPKDLFLDLDMREHDISVRAFNALKAAGVLTMRDLLKNFKNPDDLLKFRCFGRKSLIELDEFIRKHGYIWGQYEENGDFKTTDKFLKGIWINIDGKKVFYPTSDIRFEYES